MHPEEIKAISRSLLEFVEQLRLEDQTPDFYQFPAREWKRLDIGYDVLMFRRPETISALETFRRRFNERRDWRQSWSGPHIEVQALALLRTAVFASEDELLQADLERAVGSLEALPPEQTVILPIAGVVMGDLEITFRNLTIHTFNLDRLTQLRQGYNDIVDTVSYTDEQKIYLKQNIIDRTDLLLNRVCAIVTTRGDADFCLEQATREAEPIVDLLQLMTVLFQADSKHIRVGIGGDLLTRQPPSIVIAGDGSAIKDHQTPALGFRLELLQEHIEQMDQLGYGPILKILKTEQSVRSEFEAVLLRSMHWIADAERQQLVENKTTSYVTAIEMFFTSNNAPIVRDVSEGVAIVIGNSLQVRKGIADRMRAIYSARSAVSHAGHRNQDETTVLAARSIALDLLAHLCHMSSETKTLKEFKDWNRDKRLSSVL